MKQYIIIIALLLGGCATTSEFDQIDQKMLDLNRLAFKAQESGNLDATVDYFEQCIAQKPDVSAIDSSKPRRWCQNNLVGLLANCEKLKNCNPEKAVRLGEELVNNHYAGQVTLFYDPVYTWSLATAYEAVGDYEKAVGTQEHAISRIVKDSPRLPAMREDLRAFKSKLEGSQP